MKIGPGGEYFWLEVNPQGQFLFVEGLLHELQLARIFSEFLHQQALTARQIKERSAVQSVRKVRTTSY